MDEDDPVDLALLEVGGSFPEAQPQTHQAQQGGTHGKPGDQPAGQGIEALPKQMIKELALHQLEKRKQLGRWEQKKKDD